MSLPGVKVWTTDTTGINVVIFSPDGTHIISGSIQGMVHIWNIGTEISRKVWLGPCVLTDLAISRNGQSVVSSHGVLSGKHGSNTVRLWNFQTGENIHVWKGHEDSVRSVAFSPDDKYVVSGSHDKTLRLWKVGSEDAVQVWRGHNGSVRSVAFSPDQKFVISGSWDQTIKVWAVGGKSNEAIVNDLATIGEKIDGVLHCEFGHQSGVHSVAFSPDGKYVVSASEEIILCDFTSCEFESGRKILHRWQSHTNVVLSVTFTPDGNYILSGSADGDVRAFDVGSGCPVLQEWKGNRPVLSVSVSPDSKTIVSGFEQIGIVRTRDLEDMLASKLLPNTIVGFSKNFLETHPKNNCMKGTVDSWSDKLNKYVVIVENGTTIHVEKSFLIFPNSNDIEEDVCEVFRMPKTHAWTVPTAWTLPTAAFRAGGGFFSGAAMVVTGLTSTEGQKLNGKHVTLRKLKADKSRWIVEIAVNGTEVVKAMKALNLRNKVWTSDEFVHKQMNYSKNAFPPATDRTQRNMFIAVASGTPYPFQNPVTKEWQTRIIRIEDMASMWEEGLLTSRAAFDETHPESGSLTFLAAGCNNVVMLDWLNERGLCQVHKCHEGDRSTPFYYACQNNCLKAAKWLHKRGADINQGCGITGKSTPISICILRGHTKMHRWLRKVGALESTHTAKSLDQFVKFMDQQPNGSEIKKKLSEHNSTKKGMEKMMKKLKREVCAACGKQGARKVCPMCKEERYCDKTCQKARWSEHKKSKCGEDYLQMKRSKKKKNDE